MSGKWGKRGLAIYFVIFLFFLYAPIIIMALLAFQGPDGQITFPLRGFGFGWWQELTEGSRGEAIREAGIRSLQLGLATGAIVAALAFGLSMAYRRRFRGDSAVFYLITLALMTPGFLLSLGTTLFWQTFERIPSLWQTGLGLHVVWGIPFGFLVMVAVWNRYDVAVEEAARDLGASAGRTFREVTLPLVWTGLLGCFLFGFTLSWNDYDRTALILSGESATLPVQIFVMSQQVIRPDLYALGTGTTVVSLLAIGLFLAVAAILYWRRRASVSEETIVEEEMGEVAGAAARGR